jgi:hypothetical protein
MTAIAMPETEKAEAHAGKPESVGMMPPGPFARILTGAATESPTYQK